MWKNPAIHAAVLVTLAAPSATALALQIDYPETKKVEVVDVYHGQEVRDPYRWLEDVDSEETKAWVEAQNEVTFAYLESISERERIRERLTELWNYERYSTPFKEGGRDFFFKKRKCCSIRTSSLRTARWRSA